MNDAEILRNEVHKYADLHDNAEKISYFKNLTNSINVDRDPNNVEQLFKEIFG
jgi:predicted GNAT superfamily acetyltransferase